MVIPEIVSLPPVKSKKFVEYEEPAVSKVTLYPLASMSAFPLKMMTVGKDTTQFSS
jgi:hypothetical protein